MSLFKLAYTRGVLDALCATGAVKIANEELADALAAEAADSMATEPLEGEVPEDETTELAANLVELSNALQDSAEAAGAAAEVAAKAAELAATPSTSPPNTLAEAAMVTPEGADENKDRPAGFANVGVDNVGDSAQNAAAGSVGHEEPKPAPNAITGSNTATEMTNKAALFRLKAAALSDFLRKLAVDTPATADPNTIAAAAQLAGEMADAAKEWPAGHANVGVDNVGETSQNAEAGSVGHEEPKPAPNAIAGTNTAIEMTNKAASADAVYQHLFENMINTYGPYLPPRLSVNEKVAALQFLMGMPPVVRDQMARHMAKTAELPPGLAEAVAAAHEEGETSAEEKKEEEKKEEEKEEEKKEASARRNTMLGNLRNLRR